MLRAIRQRCGIGRAENLWPGSPQCRTHLYERGAHIQPSDSVAMLTARQGIATLAAHGLKGRSPGTSHNALGCLANAMLLKPPTRQMLVDLKLEEAMCSKLKSTDPDDEFLVSRILFYTTYQTSIDLSALITQHHLAEIIVNKLASHAARKDAPSPGSAHSKDELALAETLKLLYNVTHFCPDQRQAFSPAIPLLVRLLVSHELAVEKPLDPPAGLLVNAFVNLDLASEECAAALRPGSIDGSLDHHLIAILEAAGKAYKDTELEDVVTPLVAVINNLHESGSEETRQYLQSMLLPTVEDREQILGRSASLSSWLLKNSTNPSAPALRKAIASLLYDLSGRNASTLVQRIGYGYASGILFQNNLPVPAEMLNQSGTVSSGDAGQAVNPITGQFLDRETVVEEPPMTEEEKEREAERLFVLFER
jgi:hypothetical protein